MCSILKNDNGKLDSKTVYIVLLEDHLSACKISTVRTLT